MDSALNSFLYSSLCVCVYVSHCCVPSAALCMLLYVFPSIHPLVFAIFEARPVSSAAIRCDAHGRAWSKELLQYLHVGAGVSGPPSSAPERL